MSAATAIAATLEILEVDELAAQVPAHPETVKRAIRRGELVPVRTIGRSHVFLPDAVEKMRSLMKRPCAGKSAPNSSIFTEQS